MPRREPCRTPSSDPLKTDPLTFRQLCVCQSATVYTSSRMNSLVWSSFIMITGGDPESAVIVRTGRQTSQYDSTIALHRSLQRGGGLAELETSTS